MNRIFFAFAVFFLALEMSAQGRQEKFSPEKFRADMEQFIAKEACLTPKESSKFFPVYDEMNKKQRVIFNRMRRLGKVKPTDEKGCRDVIQKRDQLELELKQIQQTYHNKFMSIISASKLFDVINAEDKFHRRMLKRYNHPPMPRQSRPQKK